MRAGVLSTRKAGCHRGRGHAIPPREALAQAVRRAARLISQGQAAEAAVLLRAAEALERLSWAAGSGGE